jgi:hypothetical protein
MYVNAVIEGSFPIRKNGKKTTTTLFLLNQATTNTSFSNWCVVYQTMVLANTLQS